MHAMTWQSVYIRDVWCVFLPATRVAVSATHLFCTTYRFVMKFRLCTPFYSFMGSVSNEMVEFTIVQQDAKPNDCYYIDEAN